MKKWYALAMALSTALMMGCGKEACPLAVQDVMTISTRPGYWFHLIFIVVPLVVIIIKLYKEFQEVSDSLITMEGQVRRILVKLEDMEKAAAAEKKPVREPVVKPEPPAPRPGRPAAKPARGRPRTKKP